MSCSCAKPLSAASSSSSRTPSPRGRTSCGPGRKLFSTAGEDAPGVCCGGEAIPQTMLGCTSRWTSIPTSHGEQSPDLRVASVFQDGRVPGDAQPDADHTLWKRHCLCHWGALWPVGAWQKVRETCLLVEVREGNVDLQPSPQSSSLRLCFPLVLTMHQGVNAAGEHLPAIISKPWEGRSWGLLKL